MANLLSVEEHRERVANGWFTVWKHEDGLFRVSWEPDEGSEDHPGHTYSPGDSDLPADLPDSNDPGELTVWARTRWGSK